MFTAVSSTIILAILNMMLYEQSRASVKEGHECEECPRDERVISDSLNFHRFNRPVRAFCKADRRIYQLHNLLNPLTTDRSDITIDKKEDGKHYVLADKRKTGASFFKPYTIDDMHRAHSMSLVEKGCFWFETIPSNIDPVESGPIKMTDETTNKQHAVGSHFYFRPMYDMPVDDYLASLRVIQLNDCKIRGAAFLCDESLPPWPDTAPVPTDELMQCIAAALRKYSKNTDDDNDALFAFLYYHHIGSVDWTWDDCMTEDNWFTRLAAVAVNQYLPTEYHDHELGDKVKNKLDQLLPDYVPVFDYRIRQDIELDSNIDVLKVS